MTTIECAADSGARLGECPVWSPTEQLLYWVDIDGRAIHRYDPATGRDDWRTTPGRPGSFALTTTEGMLLVAIEHELVWFDWESGSATPWLALEAPDNGNRLNDGRCDPAGRFVTGTMWVDTSAGFARGGLYRVDVDGSVTTLRTGIGVSNGLAFDHERARMYFADTPTRRVVMWDYDVETGERADERLFLEYGDLPGKPDGACLDADGCYWSASVHGWAVIRVTPDGVVDRRIDLPVAKPTMPAFGGADLSTLFVTSIATPGVDPGEGQRDGFVSGSLLAIDVGIRGRPEPVFAGSPPR